jgi:hypothetical protein
MERKKTLIIAALSDMADIRPGSLNSPTPFNRRRTARDEFSRTRSNLRPRNSGANFSATWMALVSERANSSPKSIRFTTAAPIRWGSAGGVAAATFFGAGLRIGAYYLR